MSTVINEQSKKSNSQSASDAAMESVDAAKKRWFGLHAETRRTVCYVAVAGICLAGTLGIEYANRPAEIKEYGKVGQEYYPEFRDPTLASGLVVSTIDADELSAKEFSVEKLANGQWVIPSHHNYPADAASQLAETASSIIGIERGAMVTRWEADHPKYGVVDPQTDAVEVDQIEGLGKRLTLKGDGDAVLADYIIGNSVEDSTDEYYVRHPEEDEVYIAKLDIDLSTKFTDWINDDLLDINNWEVRELSLNNYQFDELQGTVSDTDLVSLTRESSSADWEMTGLDEGQQLKDDAVRDTLNALSNLEIVGVRPKQKGLTPELQLDRSALSSQRDVERLQADLLSRGFLLQPVEGGSPDDLRLIAREGELRTSTEDGLVYNLYFGRAFTGSNEELEFGFGEEDSAKADDTSAESSEANDSTVSTENSDEGESDEETSNLSSKPGRYVFVKVDFDAALLGEQPGEPLEPEKSQELIDLETAFATEEDIAEGDLKTDSEKLDSTDVEEKASDNSDGTASTDQAVAQTTSGTGDESAEAPSRLEQLREEFATAESKYQEDKQAFDDYQEKVSAGKEKAEELNRRFAQWFYVISGEEYDKLSLTRSDLTEAKETTEGSEPGDELQDNAEETSGDSQQAIDPQDEKDDVESAEVASESKVGELDQGESERPITDDVDDVSGDKDAGGTASSSNQQEEPAARRGTGETDSNSPLSARTERPEEPLVLRPDASQDANADPVASLLSGLQFDWNSWLRTKTSNEDFEG